jgi:hypothetical protein
VANDEHVCAGLGEEHLAPRPVYFVVQHLLHVVARRAVAERRCDSLTSNLGTKAPHPFVVSCFPRTWEDER